MRASISNMLVAASVLGLCLLVPKYGPDLSDYHMRYALAGTQALVLTEVLSHPIDTYNMRSKVPVKSRLHLTRKPGPSQWF